MPNQGNDPDRFVELADETLLTLFVGMLAPYDDESRKLPMFGGATERGAQETRTLFGEIARRWLPDEPLMQAVEWFEGPDRPLPGDWGGFLAEHPELDS